MNRRNQRHAFTLVEMIMVIVIMGLLAAVVMPKFTDMKTEAQNAAEEATVAAVRSGIKLAHMTTLAQGQDGYPAKLDSAKNAVGSETNELFTEVIEDGVTDGNWKKNNKTTYQYVPTGNKYKYDKIEGTFTKQ